MMRVSDYLYQKASVNKIPLSGCFELSPVCNFSCRMCYVRKTAAQVKSEGKRIKDWKEWLKLAEICHAEGTLYLLLTGGEPFLYPGFKELYLSLHKMGFIISINTNGTLIDDSVIEWLKQAAPSRMNITLYGASPETYQRICGNAGGYERAVSAILKLKEAGIPVVINASMIPENETDLEAIIDFGKEHGINVRMSTYMFPPVRRDREERDSRFSAEEAAEMHLRKMRCQFEKEELHRLLREQLDDIRGKSENSFENGNDNKNEEMDWGHCEEYMKCRAGRCSYWISWDGTMTACGMALFPVLVNPFERQFHDCWMELTEKVRSTPVLKECAQCPERNICNPCIAMLYSETGDVNCKSPYLCRMTASTVEKMKEELKVEKI